MGTAVQVNTAVYATTYVSAKILRGMRSIIKGCGLDPARMLTDWTTLESGVTAWLASGHLRALTLEVFDPRRKRGEDLVGRFDFTIDYGYYPDGDGELWVDPGTVAFAIRKNGAIPTGCDYRIVADTAAGHAEVSGWSTTTYRSTAGFSRHSIGAATGGGDLGALLAYYTRRTP